jgi:hypothetical protein
MARSESHKNDDQVKERKREEEKAESTQRESVTGV